MTTNHNDRAAEIQARLDAATPEEQARYFEAIGLFAEMMKATSRDTHGEEVVEAPRGAGSHIDTTATPAAPGSSPAWPPSTLGRPRRPIAGGSKPRPSCPWPPGFRVPPPTGRRTGPF